MSEQPDVIADSQAQDETISDNGWFDQILEKLIEKIDKPSIKNSLKDSLIINRITSDTIEFITISKVAQLIFNNNDHHRYLEGLLDDIMQRPIRIIVTFENKDHYFARKLESI